MKILVSLAAAGTLLFAQTAAEARESCYSLSTRQSEISARAVRLAADAPGATTVLGLCGATASSTYDARRSQGMTTSDAQFEAVATFTACAVVGCMVFGGGRCIDVSAGIFELALRYDEIDQQMIRQGCN